MSDCNHDLQDNRKTLRLVRDAWNMWECWFCGTTWGWRTKADADRWQQERQSVPEHQQTRSRL